MDLSRYRLWIFDLDGTLIDSRLDLVHAVNATLEFLKLPTLAEDVVVSFVGDGAEDLLLRSLEAAGCPADEARRLLPDTLKWFLDYYGDHCLDYTVPYPGALELLDRLDGFQLAVLTNKPLKPALKILGHLGILARFSHVIPGDGPLGKKPDPTGLAYILSSMNTPGSEAILVGDSLQDLLTAKAAGCGFMAFLGGLGDAGAITAASPAYTVGHLSEIRKMLDAGKTGGIA
jgi:phosphoglycolate phosphatase